eukprot:sb/3476406/
MSRDCLSANQGPVYRNRPDQEILVPDWLITNHVTQITSSDWLFTCFGRFLNSLFRSSDNQGPVKEPIRTRYLGHVTGHQPIRAQHFQLHTYFEGFDDSHSCHGNSKGTQQIPTANIH